MFVVISFILDVWLVDVPAEVTQVQEEGHTGFFIHLPSGISGYVNTESIWSLQTYVFKEKSEEKSEYTYVFKKNLNASKPSEHPPQVEECLKV